MRRNLFIAERHEDTWREAETAAKTDGLSLSALTALALRDYLDKRQRQTDRAEPTR